MTSQTAEGSDNICRLFIQLRLLLTNPENINEANSPATILNELRDICVKSHDNIEIFEILLKNYLLLLDTNEFLHIISNRYVLANNNFLSSFYHLLNPDVISEIDCLMRIRMFYRLLDQTISSTRILSFIKNEFDQQVVTNSCRILLLIILRALYSTQHPSPSINLSILELKKYENILFIPLITFLEQYITNNKPSDDDILIKSILSFLYVASKETTIIPIYLNIQCPRICLQFLTTSYLKSEEYEWIIKILYNISHHDQGSIILKQLNSAEILYKFTREILFTKLDYIINADLCKNLLFFINMIIFLTENSLDLEGTHDYKIINNNLLPAIEISLSSSIFMYLEFSISELLFILMRLFTNDGIVNYILQKYTISEFFSRIFKKFLVSIKTRPQDEKIILSIIILINIFWSMSFQEQYKYDLIDIFNLISTIDLGLSNYTHTSHQLFSIKRTIDGIRQNLYPTRLTITSSINKALPSVMISYSYVDKDIYRRLYDVLSKTSKLSIYADAENWKQVMENIEQSDVILFLISKEFFINKSCRQELIYVNDIVKKPFIPIIINRNFKPISWLEQRINNIRSIHFYDRDFNDCCKELLSMINEIVSIENNSSDIKQWNDKDVKQWFTNHNLIPELYEFYQFQNGNELLLYAQAISIDTWTKEYERIRLRFEKKFEDQNQQLSSHEFLKFINALGRLKYLK